MPFSIGFQVCYNWEQVGLFRSSAITAVVEKTPSQSSWSCKLRELAQDKTCQGEAEKEVSVFEMYWSERLYVSSVAGVGINFRVPRESISGANIPTQDELWINKC